MLGVLLQEDDSRSGAWREHSRDGSLAGAGVISGTAAWLLQRMRRNSSTSGVSAAGEATTEESADSAPGLPSFVGDMWVAPTVGPGQIICSPSCITLPNVTEGLACACRMNSILHPTDAEDAASDTSEAGKTDAERPPASWETPYGGVFGTAPDCPCSLSTLYDAAYQWRRHVQGCLHGLRTGVLESEDTRVWEVLWKDGGGDGHLQRLTFEATLATRAFLHKQVEAWSALTAQRCSDALRDGAMGKTPRSSHAHMRLPDLAD